MWIMTADGWKQLGGDAWLATVTNATAPRTAQDERREAYEAQREFIREMSSDREASLNDTWSLG